MRIPTYDSRRLPTGEPMGVPERGDSQTGRAMQQFGKQMQAIAMDIARAENLKEQNKAQTAILRAKEESLLAAMQDSDKLEGFYDRNKKLYDDARNKILGEIRNEKVRQDVQMWSERETIRFDTSLQKTYLDKQKADWQLTSGEHRQALRQKFFEANDNVEQRKEAIGDLEKHYAASVESGWMTETQARIALKEEVLKWHEDRFYYDLDNSPAITLARAQQGAYSIDPKKNAQFVNTAKRTLKAQTSTIEKLAKDERDKHSIETAIKFQQGNLNSQTIIMDMDLGDLEPKVAEAFLVAQSSEFVKDGEQEESETFVKDGEQEESGTFVNLLEMAFDREADISDIIVQALKGLSRKELSMEDFGLIMQYVGADITQEQKETQSAFAGLKSTLGFMASNLHRNVRNLFSKIDAGKKPKEALREVKEEVVIENNPSLADSDNPMEDVYRLRALEILKERGETLDERNIQWLISQIKASE